MTYLDEWDSYAQAQTKLTPNERRKLCLSEETLEGLHITGMLYIHRFKTFNLATIRCALISLVLLMQVAFFFYSKIVCGNDKILTVSAWCTRRSFLP